MPNSAPLRALLDALDADGRDIPSLEPHVRAYIAWAKGDSGSSGVLAALAESAAALVGAARTYRHVAVLGFAAATPGLPIHFGSALGDGLAWLAGREWFAIGRVRTFEADAIALLGVALGIAASETILLPDELARLRSWVKRILTDSLSLMTDPWEQGVVEAGRFAIDRTLESASRLGSAAPDLATMLAARGWPQPSPDHERAAWSTIFSLTYRDYGPERAATQRVALTWLYRSVPTALPGRATPSDTIGILRGVQRSLRRWRWEAAPSTRGGSPVQWAINNEYHVQDLLWVALAPIFPDLEDEENLPSLGQKHPRYDLGIPSLKLIVEVKFVYRGDRREFGAVIEQVAADASLYLRTNGPYTEVVAVVWDDSRHSEQHAELTQGLMAIRGVVGAVILTRPGRMGAGLRSADRTSDAP